MKFFRNQHSSGVKQPVLPCWTYKQW